LARDLDAIPLGSSVGTAAVAHPLTRLVVLPFRILRPDPEVDFLSFALADAVSTSLTGLPALVLRSSASAARFAVEAPDLKALATQADVDVVLTGTLMRAGDQLRATAQLVEAPAGTLVSSQVLQAPVGDLFRLQDELSQRIVEALSPSLSRRAEPARGAPASARAYEFYLRANEVARDWTHLAVARDLYRQCVEEDPTYAPGWAKLGRCHRLLAKYHLDRPQENLEVAEEAFRKALAFDPDLPLAHKLYAHHEAEMGRAQGALRRLLELARSNRNDPELFGGLVHACRYCGLLGASEAAHREATRLDPNTSTSVVFTWWARGDFEKVLSEASDEMYVQLRALALHALDRTAEAGDLVRVIQARRSRARVLDLVGEGVIAMLAVRPDAVAALRATVAVHTDPEALLLYGLCQARVGDGEAALETLTRAIEGGYLVPEALRNPWLAPIRGPRLDALSARAEAGRAEAKIAFETAGGPELLGACLPTRVSD
jgi:TolB-like protein